MLDAVFLLYPAATAARLPLKSTTYSSQNLSCLAVRNARGAGCAALVLAVMVLMIPFFTFWTTPAVRRPGSVAFRSRPG